MSFIFFFLREKKHKKTLSYFEFSCSLQYCAEIMNLDYYHCKKYKNIPIKPYEHPSSHKMILDATHSLANNIFTR